jgi:hypothetical protein
MDSVKIFFGNLLVRPLRPALLGFALCLSLQLIAQGSAIPRNSPSTWSFWIHKTPTGISIEFPGSKILAVDGFDNPKPLCIAAEGKGRLWMSFNGSTTLLELDVENQQIKKTLDINKLVPTANIGFFNFNKNRIIFDSYGNNSKHWLYDLEKESLSEIALPEHNFSTDYFFDGDKIFKPAEKSAYKIGKKLSQEESPYVIDTDSANKFKNNQAMSPCEWKPAADAEINLLQVLEDGNVVLETSTQDETKPFQQLSGYGAGFYEKKNEVWLLTSSCGIKGRVDFGNSRNYLSRNMITVNENDQLLKIEFDHDKKSWGIRSYQFQ